MECAIKALDDLLSFIFVRCRPSGLMPTSSKDFKASEREIQELNEELKESLVNR